MLSPKKVDKIVDTYHLRLAGGRCQISELGYARVTVGSVALHLPVVEIVASL